MKTEKVIPALREGKTLKTYHALYRYFPKIRAMIVQKGGSKEDSSDIFQEALIILYNNAQKPDFELSSSAETYLYSVCRHLWKDELIRRQRFNPALWDTENDNLETVIEREQRFTLAERALQTLEKRCVTILQMFYVQTIRMADIAKKLGISSENAAKTQKYKCLEAAKKALKNLQSETLTSNPQSHA